jgi:hypothetical protein
MAKIVGEDGVAQEDTPAQAEVRKTNPSSQARPTHLRFNGPRGAKGGRKGTPNTSPEKQVLAGFLGALRAIGRRRIQELVRIVHARDPHTMEFVHAKADRRAAQQCLDMLEMHRESSPHVDVDLVAYLLELHRKNPQLFGSFMGKLAAPQIPEDAAAQGRGFKVSSSWEELIAEYQRLGLEMPAYLRARQKELAEVKKAAKATTMPKPAAAGFGQASKADS